ncbi:alpha/beta hydrolase [Acinetobacter sp. ANC 3882]|uniref:alpha/beta hydrolase n=1 Tax=Acinetobacter sp. ANC 3882 TaxID=2923423 RepID=UPI001F4B4E3D|nr:alpha/beta hydrolase [Acinetobacter sp. ANC 3882]MCH7315603.1 alpha/beta hydrolase [Acinetobacter sp. ANC 3882]
MQQKLIETGLKIGLRLSFKLASGLALPFPVLRTAMEVGSTIFKPRADVWVKQIKLRDSFDQRIVHAEVATPEDETHGVLLHCHGGAFFAGSSRTHRALSTEFAVRGKVKVYMLDYRRAPEHPYPAALNDVKSVYQHLLNDGWKPEQIIFGGDSGGCALALALALELRSAGHTLPAGMVMISPYVDISLSSASIYKNAKRDPMIKSYALKRGGDGYRGQLAARNPLISPIFADLTDLPPMLIQAGSEEILVDDATHLAERAQQSGVQVSLQIYENMWHNFQMFNRFIHKSEQALDEIGSFMQKVLIKEK